MINNKYAQYVRENLNDRQLLEGIAEECAELTKAAMKIIRTDIDQTNVTTTTSEKAHDDFMEEAKDVVSILHLLLEDKSFDGIDDYWKYERWAKRLGYKE